MTDQSATLRIMGAPLTSNSTPPAISAQLNSTGDRGLATGVRTIAVTSGKGGVGKSNVAVNLALELATRKRRVTLLDAVFALANADVLLGLNPEYHLGHVLSGDRSLNEVVIELGESVRLIPGGSGVKELADLSQAAHERLIAELRAMEGESDFIIIDTAAGIAGNVTGVLSAASEVIIVTTPDPTAVVDAYAMIKILHAHAPSKPIWVVVNDAVGDDDADQIFTQLRAAATRFLNHPIEHLGTIPRDQELGRAVREQSPVIRYAPDAPASRALRLIAQHLDQMRPAHLPTS